MGLILITNVIKLFQLHVNVHFQPLKENISL